MFYYIYINTKDKKQIKKIKKKNMSTTQNNEAQRQVTRRMSNVEGKFESPSSKNKGEISKISENIKLLSSEITTQYTKRASMKNNENIHEIISNLFDKDAQLLSLTNKQSIIHELDFLQKSPTGQRKKNLKQGVRRRSTMTSRKNSGLSNQKSFSRTNSDKIQPLRKLSSFNPTADLSNKNSSKKVEFNIFDKSANKTINQGIIDSESESESIGETEREYLLFGFTNTKRIKRNRIRSMENNPKKLGFYEKNLFHKQKKMLEVEMLRNKLKNEKQQEFKEAPELTKKTKEIIREKLNETKPLYQRVDEVMESKSNYIHKLKKFHNEESKNMKWKEFNANYDNNYMHDLSHLDNLEFSHISKNAPHNSNSAKNNKMNFNTKYLNSARTPNSANNTFLKMLNDTNIDLHNVTSINAGNMHKNESMDYSDNFKINENEEKNNYENSKFNNLAYKEFMRSRKNNSNNENVNDKNNNNNRSSAENGHKRNISHNDYLHEEYVKFDIAYPDRTLNWVKNKDNWYENKKKKLDDERERSEKAENELLGSLFKPKTNKNSAKILNAKKNSSRSMNMSQRDFNNNYNLNPYNENEDNLLNYNNDGNVFNDGGDFDHNKNTQNMNKSRFNSQEKTVFESLYNRRFDGEEKRKKILREISSDFKPKINSDYRAAVNASQSNFMGESLKSSKFNNIPAAPKKSGLSSYKKEDFNDFEEANENKNSNLKMTERRERVLEMKRQREEMRNKKRKGNEDESNAKRGKKTLMDMLDEVERENQKIRHDENAGKRRKSESSQLYKLNIRSASAWDQNKENSVYYDRKFAKILTKAGTIKY